MGGLNSICKQGKKRKKEKKISCLLASPALKARLPTSTSIHGALTRLLNGNGNIIRAASDKTVCGGGERARAQHFPAGQGGERFCSLSQPNPKQYKKKKPPAQKKKKKKKKKKK